MTIQEWFDKYPVTCWTLGYYEGLVGKPELPPKPQNEHKEYFLGYLEGTYERSLT